MSKHTRGPWRIERDLIVSGALPVATIASGGASMAEAAANAQLIAAAPDLLAAIRAILNIDNPPADEPGHIDYFAALKMAHAAIAKAEGR